MLQERPFPGSGLPLGLEAALKLLPALACPVQVREFAIPGLSLFIFVLWHVSSSFHPWAGPVALGCGGKIVFAWKWIKVFILWEN